MSQSDELTVQKIANEIESLKSFEKILEPPDINPIKNALIGRVYVEKESIAPAWATLPSEVEFRNKYSK